MARGAGKTVQYWEQQFTELRREWHALRGDLLTVAGVQRREVRHSAVIGWLLDPHAGHGLGTGVLEQFLALAEIPVTPGDLASATVALEAGRVTRPGVRKRKVRADILVRIGSALVVVETKVDDRDRRDQCANEVASFSKGRASDQTFFVFLTPDGKPPKHYVSPSEAERFRPVSFRDLSHRLSDLIDGAGLTGRSAGERAVLSYRDTLTAEFGTARDELDPTTLFYLRNQTILDTWESARKRLNKKGSKLGRKERDFVMRNAGLLLQWGKLQGRQTAAADASYRSLGPALDRELQGLSGSPVLWPDAHRQADYQYWVLHRPTWRLSRLPRIAIGLEWRRSQAKFSHATVGLVSFKGSEDRAHVLERLTPILRERLPDASGTEYWPILVRGKAVRGHWAERQQFARTLVRTICDLWERTYLIVDEVLAEIDQG